MLWFVTPLLCAQQINIRVLNGHNGKPVTNECLNISLGVWNGGDLVAPTNSAGVISLIFRDGQASVERASSHACNGTAVLGPKIIPNGMEEITLSTDYYIACQEHGKVIPGEPAKPNLIKELMPSYSIKKILDSGLSAGNTCGRVKAEPRPGELIFYVKPRGFLGRMRQ